MTVGAGISGCSTVFGSSAVENGFLDKRKNTRGRFHRKEVSHLRIYIYYIIISTYTCIYIYMYLYVYIYIDTSNIIHLHVHSYSPKSIGKMTSPEFPFPTGKAPKLPFKNLSGGRYMISMEWISLNELLESITMPFYIYNYIYIYVWLVVSTHLKNMKVSWEDYSQYMEK